MALGLVLALVLLVAQHQPSHPFPEQYLYWGSLEDFAYPIDPEGVPQLQWHGALVDQPVTVAQWGLQGWDKGRISQAMKAGEWLLAHQQPDGSWLYGFDFPMADGQVLHAPWRSALAQANGISLLTRLYDLDHQARWLDGALRAYAPLRSAPLRADIDGGLFFEEYPTDPPQHVLNGAMHVALGLGDLAPHSVDAAADHDALLSTIRANLSRWDTGHGAAYGLIDRHVYPAYTQGVCALLDALDVRPLPGWSC